MPSQDVCSYRREGDTSLFTSHVGILSKRLNISSHFLNQG